MISNPNKRENRCDFQLGDFTCSPSCSTDVAESLLVAFLDMYSYGSGSCFLLEENNDRCFTLVLNDVGSIFIIEEADDDVVLHDFSYLDVDELATELIKDVEDHLSEWVEYSIYDDSSEQKMYLNNIKNRLNELKMVEELFL